MLRTTLTKVGLSFTAALWIALLCVTGESQTNFNYPDFSNTAGITLNGSATQVGNLIRLTPNSSGQAGTAIFSPKVLTSCSFQSHFQFNLHDANDAPHADGITFMIQNDAAGVNAIGAGGGGLGYQGITPIVAVEFDIFQNGPPPDNNANHVAILTNGQINDAAQTDPGFPLYGAGPVDAWVDYDATAHVLNVFVAQSATKPATPLISFSIDIGATIGDSGWVGFSGGTGTGNADQDLLNFQLGQSCVKTFLVNYFAGANGARPDQTVRVTNPGTEVTAGATADLCANIYVFRNDQQLAECCSCLVTPNGLRTLSVDFDLAHNALTPGAIGEGVIKIVSSNTNGGSTPCPLSKAGTTYSATTVLRAWGTHNQDVSGGLQGTAINQVTETHFLDATLSEAELREVQSNCGFIFAQGSGAGQCACGRGD